MTRALTPEQRGVLRELCAHTREGLIWFPTEEDDDRATCVMFVRIGLALRHFPEHGYVATRVALEGPDGMLPNGGCPCGEGHTYACPPHLREAARKAVVVDIAGLVENARRPDVFVDIDFDRPRQIDLFNNDDLFKTEPASLEAQTQETNEC